ncbi:hypothetical protein PIB30_034020 [Stylosanthes scabra]|uniref:Uncharacterized protein n=1 Tax=Stylosanthes scabra TaxID=79078 RepID=A0ABU6WAP8_9FABA|nr:hypothetical protein [Stylosanthes scabra]
MFGHTRRYCPGGASSAKCSKSAPLWLRDMKISSEILRCILLVGPHCHGRGCAVGGSTITQVHWLAVDASCVMVELRRRLSYFQGKPTWKQHHKVSARFIRHVPMKFLKLANSKWMHFLWWSVIAMEL